MSGGRKKDHSEYPNWFRLDNFANIYPISRRRNWASMFRFSAELTEEVDPDILQMALNRTAQRFPALTVQLKRGAFWFYLKRKPGAPKVIPDGCCPCELVREEDNNGYLFRVRYYSNRIAVEVFHVLTDGTGGLSFLKTLVAEYLSLKHGLKIPRDNEILDCDERAKPEEYEDSFKKYAGRVRLSRGRVRNAFRLKGDIERDGYVNIICGIVPVREILAKSREMKVSLTQFLGGVLLLSLADVQRREIRFMHRRKPITLIVPANLRLMFPSQTKRNFSGVSPVSLDTRLGMYSLEETVSAMQHQMGEKITKKRMQASFTSNVKAETNPLSRIVPLFIKIPILKIIYKLTGDRKSTMNFTNMGNTSLPIEMSPYVTRIDSILGPLSTNPTSCALLSYDGNIHINFARRLVSPKVERAFFTRLVKLGIPVKVESNTRNY